MNSSLVLFLAGAAMASAQPVFQADSARGAGLFHSLACVQCHSVNGTGGGSAPDLGRLGDRNFTPAGLAATMWNHAPAMWGAMGARGIPAATLDEQSAADLFAYFYAARFFEKPGDAARGKRVFTYHGCSGCHGTTEQIRSGVPPVSRWDNLNRPFGLSEAMWNHMPGMLIEMKPKRASLRKGAWPTLSGQDLGDLLVYVRNLPVARLLEPRFDIGSGATGPALFRSKGCEQCHSSGTDLAGRIRGRTLTELAAEMWNHAPRMSAAGATPAVFQPGEMRELLSYLWARQFFENAGDPDRGRRVFAAKRCAGCHGDAAGKAPNAAPNLAGAARRFSGPAMAAALWRHGPAMLEQMKSQGIAWPHLDAADMSGLIAYLNRLNKEKP